MEKFVIVDGNNLMFRAFFALPQLSNFAGEISNAVFGFTNMLVKIIREINPKYIAVTFDVAKRNFRHETYAEYKGTRPPTPLELIPQFPIVKDLLGKMKIKVVERAGLEADDLMGSLSRAYNTENIIVTADKDSFQLINDNTSVLFPKKGLSETVLITKDNIEEFYGVRADQVVDLKSLMGDKSDNIPGVGSVGEKTAKSLLTKYGSLDGVYAHIDEIGGKIHNRLLEDKEQAYMSQYLAKIVVDEPFEESIEDFEYDFPFNEEVRDVFKRYQFGTLLKRSDIYSGVSTIKEVAPGEHYIVDTVDKLNDLFELLKGSKTFSIYLDQDDFSIYLDKEYIIHFGSDLFSTGLDILSVLNKLKPILENEEIKKTVFDSKTLKHILHNYGYSISGIDFDCLIARYLINSIAKPTVTFEEVKVECGLKIDDKARILSEIRDVYYAKLQKMDLLGLYYDIEMPLVDVLFDMEIQGFLVDSEELNVLNKKYYEEIKRLENDIYFTAGTKFNISSPKQLGEVLFDKLDLNIPSNKKKSTSIEVLNEIEHKHPLVPMIIRYRLITKLYSTYIVGFENLIASDGKIHTVFNQTMTSTGRLSSSEPNLQNIPVRTEEGRNLRKVFIPSHKDGFLVSADYSQIELRLLANFSGDERLINAFNEGQDIHARTASEIFGKPVDEITPEERRSAKAINFGIVYGISDFGLSQNIGVSKKEAGEYIKLYFERYPKISDYMKSNVEYCRTFGYVKTMFGRIRPVPEINSTNFNLRTFGERASMNMPLQGSASDIIKLAMVKIYNEMKSRGLKSKIILQVHDELVVDVVAGELDEVKEILKNGMENVVNLDVKLTVNIESGKTWYDAK